MMWQHARAPMYMVEDGVFRQVHTRIYRSNSISTSANKPDKDHAVQHIICVGVAAPLHMFESLDEYRRGSHENPPCYPVDVRHVIDKDLGVASASAQTQIDGRSCVKPMHAHAMLLDVLDTMHCLEYRLC